MIRSTLAAGAVGGLLWFVGDMLAYGYWGDGAVTRSTVTAAIAAKPLGAITFAGLLGPLGTVFCLLGAYGFYRTFFLDRRIAAIGTCSLLAVLFVVWGSTHQLYAARAIGTHIDPASPVTNELVRYWVWTQSVLQMLGYAAALASIATVGLGLTRLPRWTALLNFGLLTLLEPAARLIPAPLGAPIVSGWSNLALALWFAVAAVVLGRPVRDEVQADLKGLVR